MLKKYPAAVLFVSLLLCFASVTAVAHKMIVEAYVDEGSTIIGSARYHTTPVGDAGVQFLAPDGKVLGECKTNKDGTFRFTASYRCDYTVVVSQGGHSGKTKVLAEDLPEDLPEYR